MAAENTKLNLSQLIRETLDSGVESPAAIVASIKDQHGVEVKTGLVSIVKNKWKADKGGKPTGAKRGRKPKVKPASEIGHLSSESNGHESVKASNGRVSIEDLLLLKTLVATHGAAGVVRLLEVIS